jgi:hypothetical protein
MTKRTQEILEEIEGSGESAAVALVDHIRTVASNGREYSTNEAVATEAENLIHWAQNLLVRIKGKASSSVITLEAMHELEKQIPEESEAEYTTALALLNPGPRTQEWRVATATAEHRADAFQHVMTTATPPSSAGDRR